MLGLGRKNIENVLYKHKTKQLLIYWQLKMFFVLLSLFLKLFKDIFIQIYTNVNVRGHCYQQINRIASA